MKFLSSRWPWLAAISLLVGIYFWTWVEVERDTRPVGTIDDIAQLAERSDLNVLFVLVDTLRAHRLGSYGYERDTSPTIDYLAETGVRFARHQSQSSWTKASMASLWAARNPMRTGVTRFDDAVPPEATLATEIFQEAGFYTTGIWRNGWVAPTFGFDQGFEFYEKPQAKLPTGAVRRDNPNIVLEGTDDDVVDSAIEFLRVHGRDRWFLYLHLMDVHQYVYDEESAKFGTGYSDLYDNSVLREDRTLGRLMWHLEEKGYLKNTLIVLTSDHGEAFLERGFEGHAREVYRETTEVPFILSFPFRLSEGVSVESPTRNIDIWPTVLDLLGLSPMGDVDGRSLVPEILASARGEAPAAASPAGIAHLDQSWGRPGQPAAPVVAVAEGDYRLIYSPPTSPSPPSDDGVTILESGMETKLAIRSELFDRGSDPEELKDVSVAQPEVVERMQKVATDYLAIPPNPWGVETPHIELEEMQLNQLRALGYDIE